MRLLLQSKSSGEIIYPFLAALYAGYLKKNGHLYTFIDLNTSSFSITESYDEVVIFISWISITRFKKNILSLHELIKKLSGYRITIICENPEISAILNEHGLMAKFILDIIPDINTVSDFTIALPGDYLSPIFSRNQYLPLINSFYQKGDYLHRDVEYIIQEISIANRLYSISSFFFEDDFNENSKEYLSHLFQSISKQIFDISFLMLGNSSIQSIRGISIDILEASGCEVVSFKIDHKSRNCKEVFDMLEQANIKSCAYIEIPLKEKSIKYNLLYIIDTIEYKTVINHYDCTNGKYIERILFTFVGYLLSFIALRRIKFILQYLFSSTNNVKKFFLKLKRILN